MTGSRFDEKDIKPCPKCGRRPGEFSIRHIPEHIATKSGLKPYAVCCGGENCRFYIMGDTEDDAVAAWNRRTDNG